MAILVGIATSAATATSVAGPSTQPSPQPLAVVVWTPSGAPATGAVLMVVPRDDAVTITNGLSVEGERPYPKMIGGADG